MKIQYDFYCPDCNAGYVTNEKMYKCPHCEGGSDVFCSPFVKCTCDRRVYLHSHTNFCECSRMYNAFGQELAPVEEWDEDDRQILGPDCPDDFD